MQNLVVSTDQPMISSSIVKKVELTYVAHQMRGMHPKHVALALNAIKDRSWPLFSPLEPSGPGGVYDQVQAPPPPPTSALLDMKLDTRVS